MKLCFSTLGCSELSLEDIVCLAKAYGISAIEVRGIGGVLNNVEIEAFTEKNATIPRFFYNRTLFLPSRSERPARFITQKNSTRPLPRAWLPWRSPRNWDLKIFAFSETS